MRSTFGEMAQKLRVRQGLSQKEFADRIGQSLARVSNLEHARTNISDRIVNAYIHELKANGEEAHFLREAANFSNSRRGIMNGESEQGRLVTLLTQYKDSLSERALREIDEIIKREISPEISSLRFSNSRSARAPKAKTNRRVDRGSLMPDPKRFAEICLLAAESRRAFCDDMEKLSVDQFLQFQAARDSSLDVDVVSQMPFLADGAFACIVGQPEYNTIYVEEDRYALALKGAAFARHALCHEYAHHALHKELLETDNEAYIPPQELAKVKASDFSQFAIGGAQIEQVVDNTYEAEAELFATMLLVPWSQFLKGTEEVYLAKDFGEQNEEIKRYSRYFKIESVKDAFRWQLWSSGCRDHPIFC